MAEPGDFQLPHITQLRAEPVNFSEEIRAAEASDRNTRQLIKSVGAIAGGIVETLQGMGEKSAMAQAQQDALHAQLQFNKDAVDLASKGKYTIKEGGAPEGYGGDPFAQAAGVSTGEGEKTLELDPSFQQSIEETTTNLQEKYKQYPKVQQFVYEQVGKFGVEAHKQAYKAAYEKAGADLKAANKESLRLLADNGDGTYAAGNTIIDNDPTLTSVEKDTAKKAFKSDADKSYVSKQAQEIFKNEGLNAALKAVGDLGSARGMGDTDKFSLLAELTRMDNEAKVASIEAVAQTVDQANKNRTSVLDALDKLDAAAPFKANMKFETDKARVDEWLQPGIHACPGRERNPGRSGGGEETR